MSELLRSAGEHQEKLWLALVAGILGILLHTVLYRQTICVGKNLLNLEFVRDAKRRHCLFEACCEMYERISNTRWMRLLGLTLSCLLIGLSIAGLVTR